MTKPTPLADKNFVTVLMVAAKGYLDALRADCLCGEPGSGDSACLYCEIRAAIDKAEGREG